MEKIQTNLLIELNRSDDGFMSGVFVLNGIRQRLSVIPRNIDVSDFFNFLSIHAVSAVATKKHGALFFKKSKNV